MKYSLIILGACFMLTNLSAQTLDEELQNIYTDYDLAGMSVAVIKEGQTVFSKGYGLAHIANTIPITDSSAYRIASVSKMVTAIGFMQLYEQGLVNLDEDIGTILGFEIRNPNFPTQSITPRMLLSHTSSINDGAAYDNFLTATYNQTPPPPLYQLITDTGTYYQANLFANKQPGTYFQYANINYGIIGTLIEKISGQRFDQYMQQQVLLPLQITTGYNVAQLPNINNLATLYRKQSGNWVPQADDYGSILPPEPDLSGYLIGSNGLRFAPQGGLRISANNLAKLVLLLLNNGTYEGITLLQPATVLEMKMVEWMYNGSNGNDYYGLFKSWGLGLQQTTNTPNADIICPDVAMWGHAGEAYGLVSDAYFSDSEQTGVVFITNGCGVGYTVPANSAYYAVEAAVFDAVCTQLPNLEVPPITYSNSLQNNSHYKEVWVQYMPQQWQMVNTGSQNWQVQVADVCGKPITRLTMPAFTSVNIENTYLPKGVYFLQLHSGKQLVTLKVFN